jgi:NADH:ubiquinone oxidoreductase subunit F (NADH-binding)
MSVATAAPARLLAGSLAALDDHLDRYGPLPDSNGLIELVDAAGLRGRGGAGFPTGRKLRAVASSRRRPVVVVNAVEGEPVSAKDRVLLRHAPHLVLDGASLAASALGANEAIVAVGARQVEAVERALAERHRRFDPVSLRLEVVPQRFVSGEETALVSWLNGRPAKPTFTPPRPFERGVGGAPTLVQNAETLANVALIARFGDGWFREQGTEDDPGTALVTLSGAVRRPGVYEIPLGLRLEELVERAGGLAAPVASFLVGGYFGRWLDARRALPLAIAGPALGARAIHALPPESCGLVESARVARYLSGESAGQCGPCVHGLDAIAGALERLAWGKERDPTDVERLERWTQQVVGRGACRHPDGAVWLVASALDLFRDEVELHLRGRCSGRASPRLPVGAAL